MDEERPNVEAIELAFAAECERLGPMGADARLVLGCSAGGDSMALLQLASGLAESRRWKFAVAHFDHAQRNESADEARFVAEQCERLGVDFVSERLAGDSPGASGVLSEGSMRKARYEFFARVFNRRDADALVLAHQADDRAETFIMRLLAGSGPTGLASIRPLDTAHGMMIARPLLATRRAELREYLSRIGIGWAEDPGNENPRYKRVWVRREILPRFNERMNADVAQRIVRTCELADEESGALTEACGFLLESISDAAPDPALGSLDLGHRLWREAGEGLKRRMLRQWIWGLRVSPYPPGFEAVAEALKFARVGSEGAALRTVERIQLVKKNEILIAYAEPTAKTDEVERE